MGAIREYRNEPLQVVEQTAHGSLFARVTASLRAGRFDRMLAVGAASRPGSALDVHACRIVTRPHREAIARTFLEAIREIRDPRPAALSSSLPIDRDNVVAAETTIDAITLRLHSPRTVSARGMARLRLVLCDGSGPFYEHGRGDLDGRLGAALAAL